MKKNQPTNRGFTLIEIIVSLAVFIVVAVIAIGAFLKILDANKQSQALQTAMNNANFALDSMARDLRVGEDFYCYDSNVVNFNVTSLPGKNACSPSVLENEGSSSNSSRVIPSIAFYSSEDPSGGWGCPNPPIHIYRYNYNTGVIEKAEQTCSGSTPGSVGATSSFVPLTDPSFIIQSFGLNVDLTSQPKVFIFMTATAGSNLKNQTTFTVQTTVSERIMNGQ